MTQSVTTRLSKPRLLRFLTQELPAMLAGQAPDRFGLARACLLHMVRAALKDIHEDFTRKSQGQQGEDGVTWEPLSPYTIKQRQNAQKGTSGQAGPGRQKAQPVSSAMLQETRDEIYRQEYRRLRLGGLPVREARRQAMIMARAMMQSIWQSQADYLNKGRAGQSPPLESPGDFPILDESGRLKASTQPGELSGSGLNVEYSPPAAPAAQRGDQQVVIERGKAMVYSHVPYGEGHMTEGTGSTTGGFRPARPWKAPEDIPETWRRRWAQAYAEALARLLPLALAQLESGR